MISRPFLCAAAACLALSLISAVSALPVEDRRPASRSSEKPLSRIESSIPATDIMALLVSLDKGARQYQVLTAAPPPGASAFATPYSGPYIAWAFRSNQQQEGFILVPIYAAPNTAEALLASPALVYTSTGKRVMTVEQFGASMLESRNFWPAFWVGNYEDFEIAKSTVVTAPARGPLISDSEWYRQVWAAYAERNPQLGIGAPRNLDAGGR